MIGLGNHHSPTLGSFPDSDKDRAQTVEWKIFKSFKYYPIDYLLVRKTKVFTSSHHLNQVTIYHHQ